MGRLGNGYVSPTQALLNASLQQYNIHVNSRLEGMTLISMNANIIIKDRGPNIVLIDHEECATKISTKVIVLIHESLI